MHSRIKCANAVVLLEICDRLNDLQILYLLEVPDLEIVVKSDPHTVQGLLHQYGFTEDAHLMVNA